MLRWATMASTSRGTAAPAAYETVSTTEDHPTRWVAATTEMAASTGPAHGTKTSPRLIPSTSPLVDEDWRPRPNREKGIARSSPTFGISSPSARTKRRARPRLRRKSAGRPRYESSEPPTRVNSEKLATMPPMMAKGRRRLPPAEPPAAITGTTGITQGEMPVISPPMKPITSNEFMRPSRGERSQRFPRAGRPGARRRFVPRVGHRPSAAASLVAACSRGLQGTLDAKPRATGGVSDPQSRESTDSPSR